MRLTTLPALPLLAALLAGCVTVEDFPDTVPAGIFHGVSIFFELKPEDIRDPTERKLFEAEKRAPVVPEILTDGQETYRVLDLFRVDYHHALFEVGGYRYPQKPNAQLYVFKPTRGDFSFTFHRQVIVVPASVPWSPSAYRYSEEEELPDGRILTHEILQIGLATIETNPKEGTWLVNGKRFYPGPGKPLELPGAIRARIAR
jgi:hypothetical protein